MDSKELVKNGRVLALKIIAESYLMSKGKTISDNMFPKNIDRNSSELTTGDAVVLHYWLMEQYSRVGLDLNKLIESTGEEIVPGKLSNLESKELIARADEFLVMMSVVKKYKNANN